MMFSEFSLAEVINISGWSLWLVLGCNSLLVTLIYERLWYVWKPFQMRKRWLYPNKKNGFSRQEWEQLFYKEQRRIHIGLPFIRNLIIICPLIGFLGCLINLILLLQQEGMMPFYTPAMSGYLVIKLLLPIIIGCCSALLGFIALKLYSVGIHAFIRHYPKMFIK